VLLMSFDDGVINHIVANFPESQVVKIDSQPGLSTDFTVVFVK
jgi:hypothetical protein